MPSRPATPSGDMTLPGLSPPKKRIFGPGLGRSGSKATLQELEAEKILAKDPVVQRNVNRRSTTVGIGLQNMQRTESLPAKPSSGYLRQRRMSANSLWQQSTLAALKYMPKDGGDDDDLLKSGSDAPGGTPQKARSKRRATIAVEIGDVVMEAATPKSVSRTPSKEKDGATFSRQASTAGLSRQTSTPSSAAEDPAPAAGRHLPKALQAVLPDAHKVLERLRAGGDAGMSKSEMDNLRAAFRVYRVADADDIHKDDLVTCLQHLGYCNVDVEAVMKLANEASTFATLEFNEFRNLVQTYAQGETARYKALFERFDEDGNGSLDEEEIMHFLTSFGYTPLRSSVREAMDLVDLDGNGSLDFEELVLLINLYKLQEGFTSREVEKLGRLFHEEQDPASAMSRDPSVSNKKLATVLTRFFGPAHNEKARRLSEEMQGKKPGQELVASGASYGLAFSEILGWARRLRQMEFEHYKAEFEKFDADGSGAIDMEELETLLKTLGFTLPRDNLNYFLEMSSDSGEAPDELDFDAFVHFMRAIGENDGFTPAEVREIRAIFLKFDEDGSGDIDIVELNDILHYMGFATRVDDMHRLIAKVDYRQGGALDFRSFVGFMRLHRESVLSTIREVFDHFKDSSDGTLMEMDARKALYVLQQEGERPLVSMSSLLEELGTDVDPTGSEAVMAMEIEGKLSHEDFIVLAEQWRAQRVQEMRQRAGFSDAEIAKIQEVFDHHDKDKTGVLSSDQVWWLLASLGFQFRSTEERDAVVAQVDQARARAEEVAASVVAAPNVDMPIVLQLLRDLFRRDDRASSDKVTKAAQISKFSGQEVAEFQEVFTGWLDSDDQDGDSAPVESTTGPLAVKQDDGKALSKTAVLRLLRSLGLKLTADDRKRLDEPLKEYAENERVDFAAFLRLMRWILDENFANIRSVVL